MNLARFPREAHVQHAPDGSDLSQPPRKWVLPSTSIRYVRGYRLEDEAFEWLDECANVYRNAQP